ncbi:hypothetical protein AMTRI_Chr04g186050 [Amborella trichopoda]
MTRVSGTIIFHNNLSTRANETVIAHYKFCSRWWGVVSHEKAMTRVSRTEIVYYKFWDRGWGVMSHARDMTRVSGTEIVQNQFCTRGGVSLGRKLSSTNSTVAATVPWLLSFWSRPTTFLPSLKWRVVRETRSRRGNKACTHVILLKMRIELEAMVAH